MDKPTKLDISGICKCCCCNEKDLLHPQAALVRLDGAKTDADSVQFDFYAVLFIEQCGEDESTCGRRFYDYSVATMVFLQPGEIFRMSASGALPQKGWILAFHPDLLYRTSLGSHIGSYTFFSYGKTESLHLSQSERDTVCCCMENIDDELHHAPDEHSATILSRQIQLMLDYCSRYYGRQFITREKSNAVILSRVKRMMDDYLKSPAMQCGISPKFEDFAQSLSLSPAYFCDLLKHLTGKSFSMTFHTQRLEKAAEMLRTPNGVPARVALMLGYDGVQRFSVVFKRYMGIAPGAYHHKMAEMQPRQRKQEK